MPQLSLLEILGILAAIVAVPIAVWQGLSSKQKKAIGCEFNQLYGAGIVLKDEDLKISYKGELLDNIVFIEAKLKNIGNSAIRRSHIFDPITFDFGPKTELELLGLPDIIDKKPANLKAEWITNEADLNRAILDFDLLNPGDELTTLFRATIRAKEAFYLSPKITARIEGMEDVKKVDFAEREFLQGFIISLLVTALIALLFVLLLTDPPEWNDEKIKLFLEPYGGVKVLLPVGIILIFVLNSLRQFYKLIWYRIKQKKS